MGKQMGSPKPTGYMLQRLRALMKNNKYVSESLQAYIIPRKDPHNSEYLNPSDERVAFISGFTGSAATAVVTNNEACLWTDGRYFLQAEEEMDSNWTLMKEGVVGTMKVETWLAHTLAEGSRVGVDPQLVTLNDWRTWNITLHHANHQLVPVTPNLIDVLWEERPAAPLTPALPHLLQYSGKKSSKKLEDIKLKMADKNADVLIVTALDDIAWLLNLRGSDIPYNPVFFAYAVITQTADCVKIHLFVDSQKITTPVQDHFKTEDLHVIVSPYENIYPFINDLVSNGSSDQKFWVSITVSYSIASLVPEGSRIEEPSPIAEMKAIKNPVEITGLINCHVRDGAALVSYLAWLEKELANGTHITEISGANRLEEFRKQQENFVGLSFETISSVGSHGAVIHYSPSPRTDRRITIEELYLCDSGAQYKDGTTDITRTVHFSTPTPYQKECFTRVLKGHIALATVNFPQKILGNSLDTLARKSLWDVGLNYLHGTGHGIGAYLNVHEGPMGISWRPYLSDPGLQEGMFLSNEPGYYEHGAFGIRIENIQRIVPAVTKYQTNEAFLTFEVVSLAPIQLKMIERSMLDSNEVEWLNNYHQRVRQKVTPVLQKLGNLEAVEWLHRETEPVV